MLRPFTSVYPSVNKQNDWFNFDYRDLTQLKRSCFSGASSRPYRAQSGNDTTVFFHIHVIITQ